MCGGELRYRIIEVTGVELNGYHLEDAAIEQCAAASVPPAARRDSDSVGTSTAPDGAPCAQRVVRTLSSPAGCGTAARLR
jgi:hypothetical protein